MRKEVMGGMQLLSTVAQHVYPRKKDTDGFFFICLFGTENDFSGGGGGAELLLILLLLFSARNLLLSLLFESERKEIKERQWLFWPEPERSGSFYFRLTFLKQLVLPKSTRFIYYFTPDLCFYYRWGLVPYFNMYCLLLLPSFETSLRPPCN